MDVSQRREATQEMHRNSGGFELVLSPLLLGLFGLLLDRWLGTLPLFTIALSLLGLVGVCLKLYYGYKYDMEQHEANAPWARHHE